VFNLIVGTGALTLPSVFNRAGWAVGITLVILLAFMRYGKNFKNNDIAKIINFKTFH